MKTYLFLHGVMRGVWLWHKIIPLLEEGGAMALVHDLPGHGSRTGERAGVAMNTYIRDVLNG